MTKRVLTGIRLDKIAAVGQPCQAPATVAIIKHAPRVAPPAIAKKTFQEALNAQLVSERISDTFWRAFENQWAVRDAFRTALADEISEGGDGTEATAGFTAAMQQIATLAATAARDAASTADTTLEAAVEEAVSKWLQHKEQPMKIADKAQLKKAVADFNTSTSPFAHVAIIKSAARDLGAEDELPADGPLAVEKTDPAVASMQREIAVLKMAPAIRKHFDGLGADAQTAFLAKSADAQQAEVDALNVDDPVLHKCLDGTEIRKSDGAAVLAMAKRQDALSKENGELRQQLAGDGFEKRALAEFPNVAKAEAIDMLKAAATVGEASAAGKSILKTLSTMNKGRTHLFKSLGSTEQPEGGSGDLAKARSDFQTEVNKIAARDSIGMGDAMSKARTEHPALFAEAYPESVEQDD